MNKSAASPISPVLLALTGTREFDILRGMEEVYETISAKENDWCMKSSFSCPDGCGQCCVNFEPDVLECEALYLASLLILNDPDHAQKIADGTYISPREDYDKGCFLFRHDSPYHCTVYGGRCLICRLFGYTGDTGKDGTKRWKPCKFYPDKKLALHTPPLEHKQYDEEELEAVMNGIPPTMAECTEQALSLTPESNGNTRPLREALPDAIKKIQWLMEVNDVPDPEPQSA